MELRIDERRLVELALRLRPDDHAPDPAQVEMVEKGLTHHGVRNDASLGLAAVGISFASHTFCEVFVGGRWRPLDFTTLGQNTLVRSSLGLRIRVHTFNDLSDLDELLDAGDHSIAAPNSVRSGSGCRPPVPAGPANSRSRST